MTDQRTGLFMAPPGPVKAGLTRCLKLPDSTLCWKQSRCLCHSYYKSDPEDGNESPDATELMDW